MSDTENTPQDQETEEESSATSAASADSSDVGLTEGDPPIIIQGTSEPTG
ncbi:MAG TPA: hypothetical protein VF527_07730 [Pyrinomonadaceae bacterium]|jgi:hypothetical protein